MDIHSVAAAHGLPTFWEKGNGTGIARIGTDFADGETEHRWAYTVAEAYGLPTFWAVQYFSGPILLHNNKPEEISGLFSTRLSKG